MNRRGQNKTHDAATPGRKMHAEYRSWLNMWAKFRVRNAQGLGHGNEVCLAWTFSSQFLKDMGPRPKGKRLCRKNPNRMFSALNCFWG